MNCIQTFVLALSTALLMVFGHTLDAQSNELKAEKAFIHTDQPYYLSGQSIQYKVYLAPYSGSSVLYVSLWNKDLEVLIDQRVEVEEGTAYGNLELSPDLPTGQYLLVAHTNWMLNFGDKGYGKKSLYLINPEDPAETSATREFSAKFYPEGNHLIAERSNKMAFRFSDTKTNIEGSIINQNGDTVSRFQSLQHGYGLTNLLAKKGESYSAIVSYKGKDYAYPLGSSKTDQLAMRVIGLESDTLSVLVNIGENLNERVVTLQVRNKGQVIVGASQLVSKPAINFTVPKSLMGVGLNQLVILNQNDQVISERLVYNEVKPSVEAEVKPENTLLGARSEVHIPVSLGVDRGIKSRAHLSVTVTNSQYFPKRSQESTHQLMIFSELGLATPGSDFVSSLEDPRFMDIFLLSQSLENSTASESEQYFAMDSEKLIPVSGKVTYAGKPVADSTVYISILSEKPQFHTAKLGADGTFNVLVYPFYGEADMILKLAQVDEKDENINYELFNLRPQIKAADFETGYTPDIQHVRQFIKLSRDNQMISRNYFPTDPATQVEKAELGQFFFNYNFEMDYTQYITLNSFTEIKRELIESISISRRTGKLRVLKHDEKRDWYLDPYDNAPLMLIDGLPVFDEKKVLNLDPAKIKDIRVMNRQYLVGGVIFDGIIELTTIDGQYYKRQKTNHQLVKLQGYHKPEATAEKESETLESGRLPDFRSVLYWNPGLTATTGETIDVSFFTSDDIGEFLLEIVGLDELGNPIHLEKVIRVK